MEKEEAKKRLQIWFCRDCNCVHFQTDIVSLNFSMQEFGQIARASMELYEQEIMPLELKKHQFQNEAEIILESELIG